MKKEDGRPFVFEKNKQELPLKFVERLESFTVCTFLRYVFTQSFEVTKINKTGMRKTFFVKCKCERDICTVKPYYSIFFVKASEVRTKWRSKSHCCFFFIILPGKTRHGQRRKKNL